MQSETPYTDGHQGHLVLLKGSVPDLVAKHRETTSIAALTTGVSAAQQAVEAVGRDSSQPITASLSPVVMYHEFGRRYLTPRGL